MTGGAYEGTWPSSFLPSQSSSAYYVGFSGHFDFDRSNYHMHPQRPALQLKRKLQTVFQFIETSVYMQYK